MKAKKVSDPYDVALDDSEKEIEDSLDFEKIERVKNAKAKIASLKSAASNYLRKDKQINIRISSSDLLRLKEAAADEGLPYQTLIASVLHKYAVGQTVHRS
jgi:predicted DNA binding CopG/RHH family protein